MRLIRPSIIGEEGTTYSGAWLLVVLPAHFTSPQVRSAFCRRLPRLILFLAGVKPAFAAATFMSGLAGAWSFLKQSV